ncbi:TrmB family transcriptional regulator [Candidatus Methanomassiliicoccus intestinalis]|nr:TrmB family transcriptional regulator [Candidatus Methanomassiliicoccus intestinalis]
MISKPMPLSKTLTKVFTMLVHGNSQATISMRLRKPKQRISEYVKELERLGYVRKKEGSSKPVIYEAGNVPDFLLDKLPEGYSCNTGRDYKAKIKGIAPTTPSLSHAPDHDSRFLNFHHSMCKVQVYKHGDIGFIEKDSWNRPIKNNTRSLRGELPYYEKPIHYENLVKLLGRMPYSPDPTVTIVVNESYKQGGDPKLLLLINPPELIVTPDEGDIWEQIAVEATKDIIDYLETELEWQLGAPILTKQKPHLEQYDESLKGISDRIVTYSESREVYLSDSRKGYEIGAHTPTLARIIVEAPEKIRGLEANVESMATQMTSFQNDLETFWSIYEMDAKRTKEAIRNDIEFKHFVMAKIGSTQQSEEPTTASTDFGVMYL